MPEISVERTIAADAATLWGMVSDITRMGEWSPEARAGEWLGGATGPSVGAKFKGRNRNGRRKWTTKCTVSECRPGEAFAFDVAIGPISAASWKYNFEEVEGGTLVAEIFDDRRSGWMETVGRFATGVADRTAHNRNSMTETLANLDRVATGG